MMVAVALVLDDEAGEVTEVVVLEGRDLARDDDLGATAGVVAVLATVVVVAIVVVVVVMLAVVEVVPVRVVLRVFPVAVGAGAYHGRVAAHAGHPADVDVEIPGHDREPSALERH